jgi:23S rRNA (adenine2030-N6)-methyltransferase
VTADPQVRMKGCGLLVINPPWHFADELQPLLPVLAGKLGINAGAAARCAWLVPET